MSREQVIGIIIRCVVKIYNAEEASLSENTNIPVTFGTKSLQRIGLCTLIEDETDGMISIGDIGKYPTIGDLADKIITQMDEV